VDGKAWLAALLDDSFVTVRVRVPAREVVFVKGIVEASEGLAAVFVMPRESAELQGAGAAYDGGALVISAPKSREIELCALLFDIEAEVAAAGGCVLREPNPAP
jgi:hypothetical protein